MVNLSPSLSAIDQRSRDIFRQLVETYLETGEPVGSRTISRALPDALSPASVRNVMADLEDAGLIYSPHTSAGRMPTHLGLRFFLDAIMERGSLSGTERSEIDRHLSRLDRDHKIEDLLAEATGMLSGLSQCAGVVVTPKRNPRLKHIEFVNLSPGRGLVVLVGEDGSVENRTIEVSAEFPVSAFTRASNYLNSLCQGQTLAETSDLIKREVKGADRELDAVASRLIEAGLAVWSGGDSGDNKTLIVRGHAYLLENVEAAADVERVRRLFEDLDAKKELVHLLGLAEGGEGVRIFIGSENNLFSLSGSSLIVAPYSNEDHKVVGVLGVIGPTRLNYARIVPMVDYTARIVGRLLT